MEVDVAAAAMIGRKVEDEIDPVDRFASGVLIEEVTADELNAGGREWLDVLPAAAAQGVDHTDRCNAVFYRSTEWRAVEGGAASDERLLVVDVHVPHVYWKGSQ